MFSSSHVRPIKNPQTISKRLMQERKPGEEERVVAKSKPTLSLVSTTVNRSPTLDSAVSCSPENYGMQSRNSDRSSIKKPIAQNVKDVNENAASSSQVWHQNENTCAGIGKSIAKADQRSGIGKSIAQILNRLTATRLSQLRDLFRTRLWTNFCVLTKNTDFEQLTTLFEKLKSWSWITEMKLAGSQRSNGILILGEDLHCCMTEWSSCQKQEYTFTQIPCFVLERWKHHQELCGIDGEPFEFEWDIFPGHTTVELLRKIHTRMGQACLCYSPLHVSYIYTDEGTRCDSHGQPHPWSCSNDDVEIWLKRPAITIPAANSSNSIGARNCDGLAVQRACFDQCSYTDSCLGCVNARVGRIQAVDHQNSAVPAWRQSFVTTTEGHMRLARSRERWSLRATAVRCCLQMCRLQIEVWNRRPTSQTHLSNSRGSETGARSIEQCF